MSQALPSHGFRWLIQEEIAQLDIQSIPDDTSEGYFLEVDLEYPHHLHDLHNNYPLAPEKMSVTRDMLFPLARSMFDQLNLIDGNVEKLIPNLNNKTKNVLHFRNLKQYLALGLKLTKIHRGLSFQESPWLKPYIDFNTEKRKAAKNDFEKDFFKLMNNAVFGKTMENLMKHVDVKLVNNEKQVTKLTCKPNFETFQILSEDLAAIKMRKTNLKLVKPHYVGMSILYISKVNFM